MTPDELMYKPGLMQGQRVLITGGGTGLGKEMAEACLILGAEVYIWGRRGNVIEAAAKELNDRHAAASGGRVVGAACDIRVPEAISEALDTIWADGGPLTGLVNNAAGNFISRTQDLSPRGFDAIANIVFPGVLFRHAGMRQALDHGGRRAAQRHLHPHHLGLERLALRGALRHVEGGAERHDSEPGGGVGALRHAFQRHRARPLPNRRHERAAEPR